MKNSRRDLLNAILVYSLLGAMLSGAIGLLLVIASLDYKELGNGLIALGVTLLVAVVAIVCHLDIAEEKKERRMAERQVPPQNNADGTAFLSDEYLLEKEGRRHRRSQERMNLDDFGIQLPPRRR